MRFGTGGSPHHFWIVQGYLEMVAYLNKKFRGGHAVEVGSNIGESALMLASVGPFDKVTCVDIWERSLARDRFMKVTSNLRGQGKINVMHCPSECAAEDISAASLDFVYIDADHRYSGVKRDIALWASNIKPGGMIGGHDYSDRFPGVIRAVDEFVDQNELPPPMLFLDNSWLVHL